jgi:hypothetical protein
MTFCAIIAVAVAFVLLLSCGRRSSQPQFVYSCGYVRKQKINGRWVKVGGGTFRAGSVAEAIGMAEKHYYGR